MNEIFDNTMKEINRLVEEGNEQLKLQGLEERIELLPSFCTVCQEEVPGPEIKIICNDCAGSLGIMMLMGREIIISMISWLEHFDTEPYSKGEEESLKDLLKKGKAYVGNGVKDMILEVKTKQKEEANAGRQENNSRNHGE